MVLIDNQVHWPLCYGSLVAGAGFEPASQVYETCGLPLSYPASKLVHVEGFEPPVFTAMGHSFTGCCRRRWATHAWRSATESNSHPSQEPPGSGRIASPLAVRSNSQTGGSGASRTRKPRRYVSLRTRWAFRLPNATSTPATKDLSPGTPVIGGRSRT
jgi:hypothetical protein